MLTIHVGLHKTGSTAIQQYLDSAPAKTKRRLIYLGTGGLLGKDGFQPTSGGERSEVLRMAATGKNVVISSEGFLGRGWNMYPNARQFAAAICDYLSGETDFQVVIFLRPQYEWFESAYTQVIQEGNTTHASHFTSELMEAKYSRYCLLIDDLIDEIGAIRLVVRAYRPGSNVVAEFLDILNLPAYSAVENWSQNNRSINPAQVEILRSLNDQTSDPLLRLQGRWLLQHKVGSREFLRLSPIPTALQEQLIELTQSDWGQLVQRIRNTRLSQPQDFELIAQQSLSASVKPFVGDDRLGTAIRFEAGGILAAAAPVAWREDRRFVPRMKRTLRRASERAASDPRGAIPAAVRFLRHKLDFWRWQQSLD